MRLQLGIRLLLPKELLVSPCIIAPVPLIRGEFGLRLNYVHFSLAVVLWVNGLGLVFRASLWLDGLLCVSRLVTRD